VQKIKENFKKAVIPIFVLLSLLVGGIAVAENSNGLITPKDPADSSTLPQRITERKNTYGTQLTAEKRKKIISQCAVAQTGMQQIKTKDSPAAKVREETYTKLATQLAIIVDHLERQSVETKGLENAQTAITKVINKYLDDAIKYKTAMDDVVIMDCKKDPEGFQATLTSARNLRTALKTDATKIKSAAPEIEQNLNSLKAILIKEKQSTGN
jgi:hypothetical protein